jgi:hypothetical protein
VARRDRDARKVNEALDGLARWIQVVKTEYEMYFMGIQRKPPLEKHRELKRMIRELQDLGINNTSQRFKLKVLRSRHSTLSILWMRTCKQIEDGTYAKHRIMADHRDKNRKTVAEAAKESADIKAQIKALIRGHDVDQDEEASTVRMNTLEESLPAPEPPPKPAARKERPARPVKRGHSVGSAELVREFSAVREKLGMDSRINAGALEARLRKHAEIVKARTGARDVRFRVVAEDGKAKLKAIPVK